MTPANDFAALVEALELSAYDYGINRTRNNEDNLDHARGALLAYGAGVERLATFGAKVLMQHHGDGDRGDVDGGWLQETAVESGVMTTETKMVPCGARCPCGDFVFHGETTECMPISNFALVRQLAATRPTEARDGQAESL